MSDTNFDLHQAFRAKQDALRHILATGRITVEHPVVIGDGTELHWRALLEEFLPKRYRVSKGFVVDSAGKCSEQVDVIIHDRTFSPLLWEHGGYMYVPAESVYAVFEVKQDHSLEDIKAAGTKAASVRRRLRTQGQFGWLKGVGVKEPFHILAGLLTVDSSWNPPLGKPFFNALGGLNTDEYLDLGCALAKGSWELESHEDPESARLSHQDTALITFCMRLLYRLQKMGTVGGIDYDAYEQEADLRAE